MTKKQTRAKLSKDLDRALGAERPKRKAKGVELTKAQVLGLVAFSNAKGATMLPRGVRSSTAGSLAKLRLIAWAGPGLYRIVAAGKRWLSDNARPARPGPGLAKTKPSPEAEAQATIASTFGDAITEFEAARERLEGAVVALRRLASHAVCELLVLRRDNERLRKLAAPKNATLGKARPAAKASR
jgi:hypothetical protein